MTDRKEHWNKIYSTKQANELSWTQSHPQRSLDLITELNLSKNASIIDIGGGDSKLVDCLLDDGFTNITVLDISEKALIRAKQRLKDKAALIKWIICNITEFVPDTTYDLWYDRAAFHFLTQTEQIEKYISIAKNAVSGFLIIGTFSDKGPLKCSGLDIHQYSETELQLTFANDFEKIKCLTEDHTTPFNTTQNFLFCSFKRSNK